MVVNTCKRAKSEASATHIFYHLFLPMYFFCIPMCQMVNLTGSERCFCPASGDQGWSGFLCVFRVYFVCVVDTDSFVCSVCHSNIHVVAVTVG